MTPDILIKELNQYLGNDSIAKRIGCSVAYVVKLRNGERKAPSYLIMDKIRQLHKEVVR